MEVDWDTFPSRILLTTPPAHLSCLTPLGRLGAPEWSDHSFPPDPCETPNDRRFHWILHRSRKITFHHLPHEYKTTITFLLEAAESAPKDL